MSEEIYQPDPEERAAHDQLEAEAESFLGEFPDHRAGALIRNLRAAAKRAYRRGRDEAIAEQNEARRLESAWRRAEIPPRLRPLFAGVDPGDEKAVQAKINELRADGIAWGDMVPPPPPPPVDQNLLAIQQMQAAASGGTTPGLAGDLETRMLDMKKNPAKYSDDQVRAAIQEYNQSVTAAARKGTSGALG